MQGQLHISTAVALLLQLYQQPLPPKEPNPRLKSLQYHGRTAGAALLAPRTNAQTLP